MVPQHNAIANVVSQAAVGDVAQLLGGNPCGDNVFGAVARDMVSRGWSVFPQDPHTRMPAKIEGRTLFPKSEHHVDERCIDQATLEAWCLKAPTASVATMFGPATGGMFAVDVDILDEAMADRVHDLVIYHLGTTPYLRVGRAPKFAAFFRLEDGDSISSSNSRIADAASDDSGHAIEILSTGKTITLHGRHHKTGHYYKWSKANPCDDLPEQAPEVRSSQVRDFLAAVAAEFPFVRPSRYTEGQWAQGVAGKVASARIVRAEGEPLARDGREEMLRDIVWRTCRLNGRAVILAAEGTERDAVMADITAAVVASFAEVAEQNGRWAPGAIRSAAATRVRALCDRIVLGDVQPSRTKTILLDADGNARDVPTISLDSMDIQSVVDQAEDALINAGRQVYQRGGSIVHIGAMTVFTARGPQLSSQRIFPINDYAILEHISASAHFTKTNKKGEVRAVTPPITIAHHLAGRMGRLRLPVLTGVVSAPTLRPDGTLISQEGFDATTGLLVDFEGVEFPAIPQKPTREQAVAALDTLLDLIHSFPFSTEAHRSVAVACILTAAVRHSLRTAPLFAFSASAAGSGKSKLVDIASIIATGREAGVVAQGRSGDEDEKRIASLLIAGVPVIAIDNCNLPVDGDLLCQMLTQTTVRPRILGKSESPELPTSVLVCATGNNLVLAGDMTRRSLLAYLDTGEDRPEKREFSWDPVKTARARRSELVTAALTVILAHKASGEPSRPALGSFEEWSATIIDAMVWLGCADPTDTMEEARANDPKLEAITNVMTQWRARYGDRPTTVRDVIEDATEMHASPTTGRMVFKLPDLRESLLAVSEVGGHINSRRLGKWLAANAKRSVEGSRIMRAGEGHGGVAMWCMELAPVHLDEWRAAQAGALTSSVEFQFQAQDTFGRDIIGEGLQADWMRTPRAELDGQTPLVACRNPAKLAICRELLAQVPRLY